MERVFAICKHNGRFTWQDIACMLIAYFPHCVNGSPFLMFSECKFRPVISVYSVVGMPLWPAIVCCDTIYRCLTFVAVFLPEQMLSGEIDEKKRCWIILWPVLRSRDILNCYEITTINMYFCTSDGELKFCNNRLTVKLIYMYILLFIGEFILKKFT